MIVHTLKMCTDEAGPEQSLVLFVRVNQIKPSKEKFLFTTNDNLLKQNVFLLYLPTIMHAGGEKFHWPVSRHVTVELPSKL